MALNFIWDAATGRYRLNGQFLSSADVLSQVDTFLAAKQGNTGDNLFNLLRSGQINVKELQLAGEREIAKAHLAAAMAAKGGRSQMSQADYGRVGGIVRGELQHWRDLMADIANGRAIDGPVKTSFRGYFAAAANTYHRVEHLEMGKRGFDEYRNRLNDGSRTCDGSGGRPSCRSVTAQGWQPVGTLPERGARSCYWNCHCSWQYRSAVTGEVRV